MSLQEPLEGENSKQHAAYLLFRNLGVGRTQTAAYKLYVDEIATYNRKAAGKVGKGKASPTYQNWSKEFQWDERAAEWDSMSQERLQASLLEKDRLDYLSKVQELRDNVETFTADILLGSRSLALAAKIRSEDILKATIEEKARLPHGEYLPPMSRDTAAEYKTLSGVFRESIVVLAQGSDLHSASLGLETVVKQLREINDENN
jgi:hypothetical protein